jgi:hypothetical protein
VPESLRLKWGKKVPDLGEVSLTKVHREIKELMLELARLERKWEELSMETFMIEDIMANLHNPNRRIESTLFPDSHSWLDTAKWFWHCKAKPLLHPALAVFFSLFAATVVVAELTIFLPALAVLNPLSSIVGLEHFISLDCGLMLLMGYIVFCVYYALFKLRFASFYGLYWGRQTDSASLLFFAMYLLSDQAMRRAYLRLWVLTSCK